MRKIRLFASAATALILAGGIEGWASWFVRASGTAAATPASVQIDPHQLMLNAKGLPTSHYDDYSLVFN